MSGNNPYARRRPGSSGGHRSVGNPPYGSENNQTNNNYHANNPYSPSSKKTQQQQQQQQNHHPSARYQNHRDPSGGDASHQSFNPYSQKTQQNHHHQQQQIDPSVYGSNINGDISFEINTRQSHENMTQHQPSFPASERQQQHRQQQPSQNAPEAAAASAPSTTANANPLLDQLREELDRSHESNFELEASVVALQAELQHTRRTLQETADEKTSKLEHELRLAQQESKRWKSLLAQQQQQQPRSIVRDAVPSSSLPVTTRNALADRLLGDSAGLGPSSPDPGELRAGSPGPRPGHEGRFQPSPGAIQGHTPRQAHSPGLPVARLARKLLEQLEPRPPTPQTSQHGTNAVPKAGSSATKAQNSFPIPMDVEKGSHKDHPHQARDDDTSIRQVLRSIATVDRGNGTGTQHYANRFPNPLNDQYPRQASSPTFWTEGKLVEWLVKAASSESSDRYLFTIVVQSSEARKHVAECVCRGWKGPSHNESDGGGRQQPEQQPEQPAHRRRRNRIRPLAESNATEADVARLDAMQDRIRQSLRNTWWNPNEPIIDFNSHPHTSSGAQPAGGIGDSNLTEASVATKMIRKWVVSLAASTNPLHLHILGVLLAEDAGNRGLTIPADDARPGGAEKSEAWWDLCFPCLANTIQRIAYRKLIRSKHKHQPPVTRTNTRSRNSPRKVPLPTNTTDHNNRRYRIGRFEDRLAHLLEVSGTGDGNGNKVSGMEVDANDSPKPISMKSKQRSVRIKGRGVQTPEQNRGRISVAAEENEDKILAMACSVWVVLLQVASPKQLEIWYGDRKGLGSDRSWQKKKKKQPQQTPAFPPLPPPCGGLFMICLLLDMLEELQFVRWMSKDPSNLMSLSRLLSTGALQDVKRNEIEERIKRRKAKLVKKGKKAKEKKVEESKAEDQTKSSPVPPSIPEWYIATIAVLAQIGQSREGMRMLRCRSLDFPEQSDWMGNAIDVSIRQLHTLALHLDAIRFHHGSILRFRDSRAKRGPYDSFGDLLYEGDSHAVRLLRGVEAWIRLWHQFLLFAQSSPDVPFRLLVLDLRDWFTSTYATLRACEEVRPELKAMIQWQMDQLTMDEEDYEESRQQAELRMVDD